MRYTGELLASVCNDGMMVRISIGTLHDIEAVQVIAEPSAYTYNARH